METGLSIVDIMTRPKKNAGFLRKPRQLADLMSRECLAQITAGSLLGRVARGTPTLVRGDPVDALAVPSGLGAGRV